MYRKLLSVFFLALLHAVPASAFQARQDFARFVMEFISGYRALQLPAFSYDYREYFASIGSETELDRQRAFFLEQEIQLTSYSLSSLSRDEKVEAAHIAWEIRHNLDRLQLEQDWVRSGRVVPAHGLYELPAHDAWYAFFVTRYTTLPMLPVEISALGKSEVSRVQQEIRRLQQRSGISDSKRFQDHLLDPKFLITDKEVLVGKFRETDSLVREHLPRFIGSYHVPPVYAMEWPGADAYTPPGMYMGRNSNAYGRDIFQYNFYNSRFNSRAIDWLYLHEAIPGHHLQSSSRSDDELQQLFLYPGNFEGWACYVEYCGKELGLYRDIYAELGKWEWDLVRSVRLVLDAGIHHEGWSKEKALAYWQQNIPGQDEIAEREITRITRWPGQVLSYKVGAAFILKLKEAWTLKHGAGDQASFHRWFLGSGNRPLPVILKSLTV